jgi:2-iminobutanoate/2-iminopropanoate deaminase
MAQRHPITGPDIIAHPQPFPTAVRIGSVIFSSAIGGEDALTGKLPHGLEEQVRNAFDSMARILARAGGSCDDVGKVTVSLRDRAHRDAVNEVWCRIFPREDDRPVRHTTVHELPPGKWIQLEFIAVL